MQKLLTIQLTSSHSKGIDKHGFVEEHLKDYLDQGWNISHITSFGGASEGGRYAAGYVIVVLEK